MHGCPVHLCNLVFLQCSQNILRGVGRAGWTMRLVNGWKRHLQRARVYCFPGLLSPMRSFWKNESKVKMGQSTSPSCLRHCKLSVSSNIQKSGLNFFTRIFQGLVKEQGRWKKTPTASAGSEWKRQHSKNKKEKWGGIKRSHELVDNCILATFANTSNIRFYTL